MLSISFSEAIFFVPPDLPLGLAAVEVVSGHYSSFPFLVNVLPSNFGIFTIGGSGPGPALAPPYKLTNAALPGQYVTLWGTGLGSARPVSVLLGGHSAPVSYAGPAPGFLGLDQINFQIPNDDAIPDSCYVAVTVQAGGVSSYGASIPKSKTPGPCRSPFGFTPDTLAKLDAGQRVTLPLFAIASSIGPPPTNRPGADASYIRTESAAANFFSADARTLTVWAEPMVADDVYYSCSLNMPVVTGALLLNGSGVDLGGKFTLSGPQNSLDVKGTDSLYVANVPPTGPVPMPSNLPAPFFTGGNWQLSDSGSASVSPFQVGFTLPPPIQITNLDSVTTIHRNADQPITWDPTGYSHSYTLTARAMFNNPFFSAASVVCKAPASAGSLVLPSVLLQSLPSSGVPWQLQVSVAARPDSVRQFAIPLIDGTALPAILQYLSSETIPIAIQ